MKKIPIIILALLSNQSLWAKEQGTESIIGFNRYYRDYSEQLIAPKKSDEYGSLNGIHLGYESTQEDWYFASHLNIDGGRTIYDGSLQNTLDGSFAGAHMDITKNTFLDLSFDVGRPLLAGAQPLTPYVTGSVHVWNRELGSMAEIYSWVTTGVGVKTTLPINAQWNIGADASVSLMFGGGMEMVPHEPETIPLGEQVHTQLSLPVTYQEPNASKAYRVTPFYRYQPIGESPYSVPVNFNGWTSYAYEPASRTHVMGLKFDLVFKR